MKIFQNNEYTRTYCVCCTAVDARLTFTNGIRPLLSQIGMFFFSFCWFIWSCRNVFRIRFGTPQSCSVRIRLKKKIKATNVRPYQVHTYVCGDCAVSRKRFMKPESLHWNVLGAVLWKSKNSQFNSISFKMNFYFLLIESEIFVVTSASILRKMKSRYDVTVLRSIVQCFIHIFGCAMIIERS